MSVIIFILKLIGIILLVLLGLILLLVLLVLFVPVRYQVYGQIEDGTTIHAKLHWFLHLLSFQADYQDEEFISCLRIFGIRRNMRRESALAEDEWEDETDAAAAERATTESAEAAVHTGCDDKSESPEETHSGEKQNTQRKVRGMSARWRRIKEAILQLAKKLSSLKEIVTDEANQTVLLATLAELKYLLKHFKFRKLVTDLQFSAGDPAATGQALGILSMLPILYQYQVSIIPDFESEACYVKGVFEIKGRMRVVHFVAAFARLWKKKEVRIFVKKLLKR